MAMDQKSELPKGFDCACGKHNEYPMYVFAHWRELLEFKCECGRDYEICMGRARLSVFPEPDWKHAAAALEAAGLSLDAISAHNMRHVIERVQAIADAAMYGSAREVGE